MFGALAREARRREGLSLRQLAARVPCDPGLLSRIENGRQAPSERVAARLDDLLDSHGELIASNRLAVAAEADTNPRATSDLVHRVQASDTTTATLEALRGAVTELCCAYSTTPALALRIEAHRWLRELGALARKPIGLSAHRDVLILTGWLALLTGCLEFDAGMRASAEATRLAAAQLGAEADHREIVGWSHEMSAWFALTRGQYRHALRSADIGLSVAGDDPVGIQLHAHRAKALARLGDAKAVGMALDAGRRRLDALPLASRPDNHFEVDHEKWDSYAMDVYRLVGSDDRAERHARAVIDASTRPDGTLSQPMRASEARLTLATVAARRGELEEAVALGVDGLSAARKSLPSLTLVAGELESVLAARYAEEPLTEEFRTAVRALRA